MQSRLKKNRYTQGSKRVYFFGYPENRPGETGCKGYSDCSSAVMKAIEAASGVKIGANTAAQIANRAKGLVVHETTGYYPDESCLLPGDCLYFKGNSAHPLDVGHVEMYTGANECMGHGSGTGPTKKNLKNYCRSRATAKRRYFMAIRWIADDDAEPAADGPGVKTAPGSWHVRTGPGTEYPSAGVVQGGCVLQKIELDGWIPVAYKGKICFIGPKAAG